ncbi:MAG: DUF6457 domain-containing protein [Microbacteriaceae bacterium]
MPDKHDDDALLEAWCLRLSDALELKGLTVDVQGVLGLAGRAAHAVARPAAPLTTFIVGYAAGLATPRAGGAIGAGAADADSAIAAATAIALRLCREAQSEAQAATTNE